MKKERSLPQCAGKLMRRGQQTEPTRAGGECLYQDIKRNREDGAERKDEIGESRIRSINSAQQRRWRDDPASVDHYDYSSTKMVRKKSESEKDFSGTSGSARPKDGRAVSVVIFSTEPSTQMSLGQLRG